MSKGKFIVFEGIDGSGKTTQAHSLVEWFNKTNRPTFFTAECTTGPIGKVIREEYLSGKRKADPKLINILYAADRLDHITGPGGMLQTLEDGINVVCDRYYYSSMAYYMSEFTDPKERYDAMAFMMNLNNTAREILKPDIVLYIDVNPKVAIKRINKGRRGEKEVYENLDRLTNVYNCYTDTTYYCNMIGDPIVKIYGDTNESSVFGSILTEIDEMGLFSK